MAGKKSTHCRRGHLLAGSNVRVRSDGGRTCVPCEKQSRKEYRQRKAEGTTKRTTCPRGHPLTATNLYLRSDGRKCCLTCKRQSAKDWAARRRAAGFKGNSWSLLGWLSSLSIREKQVLVEALVHGNGTWQEARRLLDLDRLCEAPKGYR